MKLTFKEYRDKVYGCYMGKTIGGTLGAPFECYRGVYDIDFYVQDTSVPFPTTISICSWCGCALSSLREENWIRTLWASTGRHIYPLLFANTEPERIT